MRAVILAGGKGTRLMPYTTLIPKPLMPIGGEMPILEIIIRQLVNSGVTHITLAVNHLANLIMAFFGDGSKLGVKIDYSIENKPLGTIGPLKLIEDLPKSFLVLNGDLLCNINFKDFFDFHIIKNNHLTISLYKKPIKVDFGVLEYDDNQNLIDFVEKPTFYYNVSMGIYVMERSLLEIVPSGQKYGFDNLILDSLEQGKKIGIKPFDGFWLDIGVPDEYIKANEEFANIKKQLLL